MSKRRIRTYPCYKGNYWAIVLGPKDPQVKPWPLTTFVRTASKKRMLEFYRAQHPGMVVRAIPQPNPPMFEPGM